MFKIDDLAAYLMRVAGAALLVIAILFVESPLITIALILVALALVLAGALKGWWAERTKDE